MTRRIAFAFVAAVIFAAAATASVRQSIAPPAHNVDPVYRTSNNKPYYLKGRIVDGCFDHSPQCVLLAW